MIADFVTEAEARIEWADSATTRVESMVAGYLCSSPADAIRYVSRSGNEAHFRYERSVAVLPSIQLRFAVGDVIHNIRSTADNLIWGLGQEYGCSDWLSLKFREERKRVDYWRSCSVA